MNKKSLRCPVCSADETKVVLKWKQYHLNHCTNCQVVFTDPLPNEEELATFYQGFLYRPPDLTKKEQLIQKRKTELQKLFSMDDKPTSSAVFLDYGGGTGVAYAAAKELGLEVYYQDVDQAAQAFVEQHFGLSPSYALVSIDEIDNKFDYVFSDNVIEHVINPRLYLEGIRIALKEGGQAVLKTPHARNTEILFFPLVLIDNYFKNALKNNSLTTTLQAMWQRFWHCDPPRHLYSFSSSSLLALAKQAGFTEDKIAISFYHLPVFRYSLCEKFFDFKIYRSLKSMIIRVFMLPFMLVEVLTKCILLPLRYFGIVSPAGIILTVNK